jgi:hypothetical protein
MRARTFAFLVRSETERPAPDLAQRKSEAIRGDSQFNFRQNWKTEFVLRLKLGLFRMNDRRSCIALRAAPPENYGWR